MLSHHQGPADVRRLVKLYRELSPSDRETLLAFAEFLGNRLRAPVPARLRAPQPQPRPERETVIAAIKRLSQTYDMLDPRILLNETSVLMSAHLLQGRSASDVIDELEALFARRYQGYLDAVGSSGTLPVP